MSGSDTVDYSLLTSKIVVSLKEGTNITQVQVGNEVAEHQISNIENIIGSNTRNDTLTGNSGVNTILGKGGDDIIDGGLGADTLDGGTGINTLSYTTSTRAVRVDLSKSSAITDLNNNGFSFDANGKNTDTNDEEDKINNFTTVNGSQYNDELIANDKGNTLLGQDGADQITGGLGSDYLDGGLGSDIFKLGSNNANNGNDTIIGGSSIDTIDYSDITDSKVGISVTLDGKESNTVVFSSVSSIDVIKEIENVTGGAGNDTINGDDKTNVLIGNAGDDKLSGNDGSDTLFGNDNDDILDGGKGSDTLFGGKGSDTLIGGEGIDYIDGGEGEENSIGDSIDFSGVTSGPLSLNLMNVNAEDYSRANVNYADDDYLKNIENIKATKFDDMVMGDNDKNVLEGLTGNDTLIGENGNDTLKGGRGDDIFKAGLYDSTSGNNLKDGDDGADFIDGGVGGETNGDTVDYSALGDTRTINISLANGTSDATVSISNAANDIIRNIENIIGSSGNDTIVGNNEDNTLDGSAGNDTLWGAAGNDTLIGGAGLDTATYENASKKIIVNLNASNKQVSEDGDNSFDELIGIENITGSKFNDIIVGDNNINTILGGAGDDTISGGKGNDVLKGGAGTDTLSYANTTSNDKVIINLSTNQASVITGTDTQIDTISEFDNIITGESDDNITGSNAKNIINAGAGNDILNGGAGNDILNGEAGNDTFISNSLDGTKNVIDGGAGSDTVDYSALVNKITLSLDDSNLSDVTMHTASSTVILDSIKNIENISAGQGDDTISGNSYNNTLLGNAGDDQLDGKAGNDRLFGGAGSDTLKGGLGDDYINGGDDIDIVDYSDATSGVSIDLSGSSVTVGAGLGIDTLVDIEGALGSKFDDVFFSNNNQNNTFYGGDSTANGDTVDYSKYLKNTTDKVEVNLSSNTVDILQNGIKTATDTLDNIENITGTAGHDIISGDDDKNTLKGAKGDDTISGGIGIDYLDGGEGNDTVDYSYSTSFVKIDLNSNTASIGVNDNDTIIDFENVKASNHNDIIVMKSSGGLDGILNKIDGLNGTDTIDYGHYTSDLTIDMGAGTVATGDNDILTSIENVIGGIGNDTFKTNLNVSNTFDGNAGFDVLDYSNVTSGIEVTLNSSNQTTIKIAGHNNDLAINIENIKGSSANDTLIGDALDNILYGNAGNDYISGLDGNDSLYGGTGDDNIFGGRGLDYIEGGAGADTIDSGAGNDTVYGGDGKDTINSGIGDDIVYGGAGNDVIDSGGQSDTVYGGAGDDHISTQGGDDTVYGGLGKDSISGGTGADVIYGDDLNNSDINGGDDTVFGGSGNDTIYGGYGDDTLAGGANDDIIDGGEGNDTIDYSTATSGVSSDLGNDGTTHQTVGGGQGIDKITGIENVLGSSFDDIFYTNINSNTSFSGGSDKNEQNGDTVDYSDKLTTSSIGLQIDLSTGGKATFTNASNKKIVDTLIDIENITGGAGSDTIVGDDSNNTFKGNAGDDTFISSGEGKDHFDGGAGTDTLSYAKATSNALIDLHTNTANVGANDQDTLNDIENILATKFDDTIIMRADNKSNTIDGKAGNDTISYTNYTSNVNIDLSKTSAQTVTNSTDIDTLINIENVITGSGNDILKGSSANNSLSSDAGDDTFLTSAGDDYMDGGNEATGNRGNDLLDYSSITNVDNDFKTGGLTIRLDGTTLIKATLNAYNTDGTDKTDSIINIEHINGTANNDTIFGDDASNILKGQAGDDYIDGGSRADTLVGGEGDDTLKGGVGDFNDLIYGGTLNGLTHTNSGNDTVDYSAALKAMTINLGATDGEAVVNGANGYAKSQDQGLDSLFGIENVIGSTEDDTITGSSVSNIINSLQGDDTIISSAGNDTVNGGLGSDTINYSSILNTNNDLNTGGFNLSLKDSKTSPISSDFASVLIGTKTDKIINIENVIGTQNNDIINGNSSTNILNGQAGNDTLSGGLGNDTLNGGAGNDTVSYTYTTNGVNVNLNTEIASVNSTDIDKLTNIQNVIGTSVSDTLEGNAQVNILNGKAGDDTFISSGANDTLIGGAGSDTVDYSNSVNNKILVDLSSSSKVSVVAQTGDFVNPLYVDTLIDIDNIIGTKFNDTLTGNNESNILIGHNGSDTLNGKGGADILDGGAGDDFFIVNNIEESNNDQLIGDTGFDTVNYQGLTQGITVSLNNTTVATVSITKNATTYTHTLTQIENIIGTNHNDDITGGSEFNKLQGMGGDDIISGQAGDDILYGGSDSLNSQSSGNDTIYGKAGEDKIYGGDGNDTLYGGDGDDTLSGGDGDDTLSGELGADIIYGGAGADTIVAEQSDNKVDKMYGGSINSDGGLNDTVDYSGALKGMTVVLADNYAKGTASSLDQGNDDLYGIENIIGSNLESDTITGNNANNTLSGKGGDDKLYGGDGKDELNGGIGKDTLYGQNGIDTINGGAGNDTIYGGKESDTLNGNAGNDLFILDDITHGSDNIDGGAGNDTIDYSVFTNSTDKLIVDLSQAGISTITLNNTANDIIKNIENIIGTNGDDTFTGNKGVNTFKGGEGEDTIKYTYATSGVHVNLDHENSTESANIVDTIINIENVIGSSSSDTFISSSKVNNKIDGGDSSLSGDTVDYSSNNFKNLIVSLNKFDDRYSNATFTNSSNQTITDELANIENIIGTSQSDRITGNDHNNTLSGGAGDDTLKGLEGNDYIEGGTGNDTIDGGLGIDKLFGNEGNDKFISNNEAGFTGDEIDGGDGSDTVDYTNSTKSISLTLNSNQFSDVTIDSKTHKIKNIENVNASNYDDIITGDSLNNTLRGFNGVDTLNGGSGDDYIDGGANTGIEMLSGGEGNDTIIGGDGIDSINGNSGNDIIYGDDEANTTFTNDDILNGNDGNDTIYGGKGDDTLIGGKGNDSLSGGAGSDTVSYLASTSKVSVNLSGDSATGNGVDIFDSIENIIGSRHSDILQGDDEINIIEANNGDDIITGFAGNDTIKAGAGDDTIIAGLGDDSIDGGVGNDTIDFSKLSINSDKDDTRDVDGFRDDTSTLDKYNGIEIDLDITTAQRIHKEFGTDIIKNIENVIGSNKDDYIKGNASNNVLDGASGDDLLLGLGGQDTFYGGTGNDTIDFVDSTNGIHVNLSNTQHNENSYRIQNDGYGNKEYVDGVENIIGSKFDDTIIGDNRVNSIYAGEGDDFISGGKGADYLDGEAGSDTVDFNALDDKSVTVNLDTNKTSIVEGNAISNGITTILKNIENVHGTRNDDTITGSSEDNTLLGKKGNDTFKGLDGSDYIDGGDGIDKIDYSDGTAGINIDLSKISQITTNDTSFAVQNDGFGNKEIIKNIENIIGTSFNDIIIGNIDKNVLFAGKGNDTLSGNGGDDTLYGGKGNDTFKGGAGNDVVYGNEETDINLDDISNTDTVDYSDATSNMKINLSSVSNIAMSNGQSIVLSTQSGRGEGFDKLYDIENIIGSSSNDTIIGSNEVNTLSGNAGNDILKGGAGADVIFGGAGNDTVLGGLDGDTIYGGSKTSASGIDWVDYSHLTNSISINADLSRTLTNEIQRIGVNLSNTNSDKVHGINNIKGTKNNDIIKGSDDQNLENSLSGYKGDDSFISSVGIDYFDGGEGNDTLSYANASNKVVISLIDGKASNNGYEKTNVSVIDTITGIENIIGSNFNDNIIGNNLENTLKGGKGDDTLKGGKGDDILYGEDNNDTLYGGKGNDTLSGGKGDDLIVYTSGDDDLGDGNDKITGAGGIDTLSYKGSNERVLVNLDDQVSSFGTISVGLNSNRGEDTLEDHIEIIEGGSSSDIMNGFNTSLNNIANFDLDKFKDTFFGFNGNDTLNGGIGDDILNGGEGDDKLNGQHGNDIIDGGAGVDTIAFTDASKGVKVYLDKKDGANKALSHHVMEDGFGTKDILTSIEKVIGSSFGDVIKGKDGQNDILFGMDGDDTIIATTGTDIIDGGEGNETHGDWLSYGGHTSGINVILNFQSGNISNIENLIGSSHSDILTGDAQGNTINGMNGNDTIKGEAGRDVLSGGAGNDTLDGGTQNDILDGGAGNDTLDGGLGDDILRGGDNDDTFINSTGTDMYDGGAGIDVLEFSNTKPNGINIDLSNDTIINDGYGNSEIIKNVENIIGSGFDDIIKGNNVVNTLRGGDGNDTLTGGLDGDILFGAKKGITSNVNKDWIDYTNSSSGIKVELNVKDTNNFTKVQNIDDNTKFDYINQIDNIIGSSLNDELRGGAEQNTILAGKGNDTIFLSDGNDSIDGGEGSDWMNLEHFNPGDTIKLSDGKVGNITFSNIENIFDSSGASNREVHGSSANNTFVMYDGKDIIYTKDGGNNVIDAGNGDDIIRANGGSDVIIGGDGIDTLDYEENAGTKGLVIILKNIDTYTVDEKNMSFEHLSSIDKKAHTYYKITDTFGNTDYLYKKTDGNVDIEIFELSSNNDTMSADDNANTIYAGLGNDIIYGNAGDDYIAGEVGNDTLYGGAGNDYLLGSFGDDKLYGDDGSDTLHGNIGADILYGGAGNDTLLGHDHNDTLYGDAGNDTLYGGTHNDTLYGGIGADELLGEDGDDKLYGGAGSDILNGGEGNDGIYGGTENDHLYGRAGSDSLYGEDGNDALDGGDGNDYLRGGAGNDILNGEAGDDTLFAYSSGSDTLRGAGESNSLYGGAGKDNLKGDSGNDYIDGGTEDDLLYGYAGDDTLDGGEHNDQLYSGDGNDTLYGRDGIDLLEGGAGNDKLYGGAGEDKLYGGAGNDTLNGGEDNDKLYGGLGDNTLAGDAGDDTIYDEEGSDIISGGTGNDTLIFTDYTQGTWLDLSQTSGTNARDSQGNDESIVGIENIEGTSFNDTYTGNASNNNIKGGAGNDTITMSAGQDYLDGGAGINTLILRAKAGITAGVENKDIFNITSGTFSQIVSLSGDDSYHGNHYSEVKNFRDIIGTAKDDKITGTSSGNNTLKGEAGNDLIFGLGGNDKLEGGSGNDILDGGYGDDILDGGAGSDTAHYLSSSGGVNVDLETNIATGAGTDTLISIENIVGSNYDDILKGNDENNTIYGAKENDTIYGKAGEDVLYGGTHNDTLYGGAGNDILRGEDGDDILYGGTGNDTLIGEAGDDKIYGDAGNDILKGGQGEDILRGGLGDDTLEGEGDNDTIYDEEGTDTIIGGSGSDTLIFTDYTQGTWLDLSQVSGTNARDSQGNAESIVGMENIIGTRFDDTFIGNAEANSINGGAGKDILEGKDGKDTITAGKGDDTIFALGDGDSINGGSGNDWIDYSKSSTGITIDFDTSEGIGAYTDDLESIEHYRLSNTGSNSIIGNNSINNSLIGGTGDDDTLSYERSTTKVFIDLINKKANGTDIGTDIIDGFEHYITSSSNDTFINNQSQGITLNAMGGNDLVDYSTTTTSLTVDITALNTTISDNSANDVFTNIEHIISGASNDVFKLSSTASINTINANAGDDTLEIHNDLDLSTFTFLNFEKIKVMTNQNATFDINNLNTKTYNIELQDNSTLQITGSSNIIDYNFSKLTISKVGTNQDGKIVLNINDTINLSTKNLEKIDEFNISLLNTLTLNSTQIPATKSATGDGSIIVEVNANSSLDFSNLTLGGTETIKFIGNSTFSGDFGDSNVSISASVILDVDASKIDKTNIIGDGTLNITNLDASPSADFSNIDANLTVNADWSGVGTLTSKLANIDTLKISSGLMSVSDKLLGDKIVTGTGDIIVEVDTNSSRDFSNLQLSGTETINFTGISTFTGNFRNSKVSIDGSVSVDASIVSGKTISGTGTINVNHLEQELSFDFVKISSNLTVNASWSGIGIYAGNLTNVDTLSITGTMDTNASIIDGKTITGTGTLNILDFSSNQGVDLTKVSASTTINATWAGNETLTDDLSDIDTLNITGTMSANASKISGQVINGAGTLNITNLDANASANFAKIASSLSVNANWSGTGTGTLTSNLTNIDTLSISSGTMSVSDDILGSKVVSGAGSIIVEVNTNSSQNFSNLQLDTATNETILFTGDSTFTGDFSNSKVSIKTGVTLSVSDTILGSKEVNGAGNIIVEVNTNSSQDFSNLTLSGTETIKFTGNSTYIGDFSDSTVSIELGVTLSVDASKISGKTISGNGALNILNLDANASADFSKISGLSVNADWSGTGNLTSSISANIDTLSISSGTMTVSDDILGSKVVSGAGNIIVEVNTTSAQDFSNLTLSGTETIKFTGNSTFTGKFDNSTVSINTGVTLSVDASKISGKTINGNGTLNITNLDASPNANFSKVNANLTVNADWSGTGTGTLGSDLTNIGTLSISSGIMTVSDDILGSKVVSGAGNIIVEVNTSSSQDFSNLTLSGTETIKFTGNSTFTGKFDNSTVSINSGVTLSVDASKISGKTISGNGALNITNLDDNASSDFSKIASTLNVNADWSGTDSLTNTTILVNIDTLSISSGTMTVSDDILGSKVVSGAGNIIVEVNTTSAQDFSNIKLTGTETILFTGNSNFTGDFSNSTVSIVSGVTLSVDASKISGKTISGDGTLNITNLDASPNANFSKVNANLTVNADWSGTGTGTLGSDLTNIGTLSISSGTMSVSDDILGSKIVSGAGNIIVEVNTRFFTKIFQI